jgi:replicative DNA helicase
MEKASFSRHGKDFQEKLSKLMFEDRAFCSQISEVLDVNFFELSYLQLFVKKVLLYKEKYDSHPNISSMTTMLRTDLADESPLMQKQIRDYYKRVLTSSDTSMEDAGFIKDTALDFCRKQKYKEAVMKSLALLEKSSFDEIQEMVTKSLTLGAENNFGHDYILDFEKRFEFVARNPVTTGWDEVDKICKGGLGKGELGVVIAPTGAGKSMALVHIGATAVKMGKSVIHYTLELQDTVVASRYDSCITKFPLSSLMELKEEIYEKVKDIDGSLTVKEYPTKSASTNNIRAHLEKLKNRGQKIDMMIVDYADLLRPKTMHKEKRIELESIYEELRGIAQEFECPIWTASQTNRSGVNAEVITMEAISEAFNKCFVADFICTISRTHTDKQNNTGRMFVAKNRNGEDGIVFPLFMDTSNVKIEVMKRDAALLDHTQKSDEDQMRALKEKYNKFKKKSGR